LVAKLPVQLCNFGHSLVLSVHSLRLPHFALGTGGVSAKTNLDVKSSAEALAPATRFVFVFASSICPS
jgi:hypothetical protein